MLLPKLSWQSLLHLFLETRLENSPAGIGMWHPAIFHMFRELNNQIARPSIRWAFARPPINNATMATTKSIDDELRKLLEAASVPDISAKLTDLKVT